MIVKKISVKNSFLYLVAYFVDKKTKQWFRTWRRRRRRRRGIRWLHVCANVCVSVCVWASVRVWQRFICTEECVTCCFFFLRTRSIHRPHRYQGVAVCPSAGWGRGVDAVQIKTVLFFFFFLGKRQKSRCCNWNSFQLVSAYFNLFLYCDGKIKKCTDRSKRGPLCLFVPPRCGPMWNHSVEIIDVSNNFIYRGKSAQNNHSQTCWPGFAKGQICVLIWESNMWTCF